MAGRRRDRGPDWDAAERVDDLLAERGWSPRKLQEISEQAAEAAKDPTLYVSYRTVYRVLDEGLRPRRLQRHAIAAALGVRTSQIWRASGVGLLEPLETQQAGDARTPAAVAA